MYFKEVLQDTCIRNISYHYQ